MAKLSALILCAGHGTRIRPMVKNKPKCLIKVGSKPVIDHIIDNLERAGVNDVWVNIHHNPRPISKYLGVRVNYFFEPELLGEERTIKALQPDLSDPFFVVNGDTLIDIEIKGLLDIYRKAGFAQAVYGLDGVYTGYSILDADSPNPNLAFHTYTPALWFDVGTPRGLRRARRWAKKRNL